MITVGGMAELGGCPCEVCSSQDDEQKPLERQWEEEVSDKE